MDEIPRDQLTGALRRGAVKKNVAAIHVSGKLTLLQRKLSNVLLLNAYDTLTSQARHQIEILGVDHQRLQGHHLKTPVIETGGQQLRRVFMLLAVQVDGQRQTQFQLRTRGQIVDRAQVDLPRDRV